MKTTIAIISSLFEPEKLKLKSSVNYLLKFHKNNNVWPHFLKLPRFWRAKLFSPNFEILMWDWSSHKLSKFLVPTKKISTFYSYLLDFSSFLATKTQCEKRSKLWLNSSMKSIFFLLWMNWKSEDLPILQRVRELRVNCPIVPFTNHTFRLTLTRWCPNTCLITISASSILSFMWKYVIVHQQIESSCCSYNLKFLGEQQNKMKISCVDFSHIEIELSNFWKKLFWTTSWSQSLGIETL